MFQEMQFRTQIPNPIFIVGCGHSGNSLMLTILGSHTNIYPIPYESALFSKDHNQITKTLDEFEEACLESSGKRFVEKTPRHIYFIDKIFQYRPQSKIILMLRDGRDVACSIKTRTKNFIKGVNRWVDDNLQGLAYWNNDQVKVVKYEDLVCYPEKTLQNIFEFLEEDYNKKILNYYQTPRQWFGASENRKPQAINSIQDHKNLRNWQINQPLFDGRGKWRSEMTIEEKKIFKSKAQNYLEQFGYVDDDNW